MTENELKYLIFRIEDELYGSPLLSIREVLEYQKPKHMPNMVHYFSGVINVRGAIVGVIDLRLKMNCPNNNTNRTAMLLCDTERGTIAAIVDSVDCVHEFHENEIEKKPAIQSKMPLDYLIGVAKKENQLITIVDLHNLMTQEELKAA